jgi:transposase
VNLAANLVRSAAAHPGRPAVRLDETILTYVELDERAARAARLLVDRGVRPGDRVALMLPNVPEFAILYFGVLRVAAGGPDQVHAQVVEERLEVASGEAFVGQDDLPGLDEVVVDFQQRGHHFTLTGKCFDRHRNDEFVRFLRTVDTQVPKKLQVHVIVDNYGTHTHDNVKAWLAKHPRFHLHFTPTSSSWLNLVECWFADLTSKAIRRGVFSSVPDLITAIEAYLTAYNNDPKPLVWTATAQDILAKVRRGRVALNQLSNQN